MSSPASCAAAAPPRRPRSPAAGEDRRGALLRIAARRFADHGFGATTMREIARDASILSGSIYHHFATKEDMLHAIVRDAAGAMAREAGLVAAAEGADAERKLTALILLAFDELFTDADAFAILYNERRFFRGNPAFRYVADAKHVAFEAWHAVLQEGIAAGRFRVGLDSFLAITTVVRMVNTCADWIRHGQTEAGDVPHSREAVIGFHVDFILRSVRASVAIDQPPPVEAARRLMAKAGVGPPPEEGRE